MVSGISYTDYTSIASSFDSIFSLTVASVLGSGVDSTDVAITSVVSLTTGGKNRNLRLVVELADESTVTVVDKAVRAADEDTLDPTHYRSTRSSVAVSYVITTSSLTGYSSYAEAYAGLSSRLSTAVSDGTFTSTLNSIAASEDQTLLESASSDTIVVNSAPSLSPTHSPASKPVSIPTNEPSSRPSKVKPAPSPAPSLEHAQTLNPTPFFHPKTETPSHEDPHTEEPTKPVTLHPTHEVVYGDPPSADKADEPTAEPSKKNHSKKGIKSKKTTGRRLLSSPSSSSSLLWFLPPVNSVTAIPMMMFPVSLIVIAVLGGIFAKLWTRKSAGGGAVGGGGSSSGGSTGASDKHADI